jgi:PST family polysaccharide transporter
MSALSNARWLIVIQGYKITLQLVGMSVLARLLPPSDYGLMAMAWTAANFASLLKDLGTSSAIIQKQELSERTKSAVFWLQMSLGMLLGVSLLVLSGVISAGFKQPQLQPILCLLALTFPLGSLSAVHQALLERQSSFKTLARIEIVASSASLLVAIVTAMNGAGVYAFVWQSFTTTLLYVIQPWLATRWRPQMVWDSQDIKAIFGFSGNLSAFNLINFASRNADSMIIGRFLGAAALGTYSMAYKLMLFPLQNLTFVASRALFPVMSRKQDSNVDVGSLYLRALAMVAAISTPLMGGLYVLREPLTAVVFGQQWGDVAHVIQWLAPVGALQAIISTTGTIYMAKGRTDLLFRLGVLSAALTIGSFFAGLPQGVVGVAMFYLGANLITFVPQTYFASRLIQLAYPRVLKALAPALLCSLLMMPVVYWAFGAVASFGNLAGLVVASCAGALTYALLYFVFFRRALMQLLQAILGEKLARFSRAPPPAGEGAGPKRVWLFIDMAPLFGGHEVMLLRWIEELKAGGTIEPMLVCPPDMRLTTEAGRMCEVVTVAGNEAVQGKLSKLLFVWRMYRVLVRIKKAHRPELVVIAEGSLFAQRFGLYASRLSGLYTVVYVPLVASFSSMNFPEAPALERRVKNFYGKLPHAWLTITEAQASEFRAWSDVKQTIFTLPNTVQTVIEDSYAQGLDGRRCLKEPPLHILVLGRLDHHQKGLDLLLDYLRQNPQLADDFVIHFAGEGPYADTLLAEKQRDSRMDQLIRIEPWGSPLDIFRQCDVLLIPSRYEGVPLVMLEAMAFGLPVVASDLSGTRAYLPAGCLFPVGEFDKAFKHLSTLRRFDTRAARIARRNLMAFKRRASGAAFSSAVTDLTARLGQAAAQSR